ncbi:MAG TPA: hypothetical protein VF456_07685 [Vicinamibacterales bacterium]
MDTLIRRDLAEVIRRELDGLEHLLLVLKHTSESLADAADSMRNQMENAETTAEKIKSIRLKPAHSAVNETVRRRALRKPR